MTSLLSLDELLAELRKRCDEVGSQNRWAIQNGMRQAYVSFVLDKRQGPGPKVLAALGYEKVVMYRKKRKEEEEEG